MRSFKHHMEVRQNTAQTVVHTPTLAGQGGRSKGCKHIHNGARRLTVVYVVTCTYVHVNVHVSVRVVHESSSILDSCVALLPTDFGHSIICGG